MTGTKIDTIKIRQLNREQTFEYIKKNPMAARADVAKELNLSFPTVTSIVTELEEAGLIRAETTHRGGVRGPRLPPHRGLLLVASSELRT